MTDTSNPASSIRITLDAHDSLPELMGRIREAKGHTVILEIPDHSSILLTATEFRTLKEIAEQNGVTLKLQTEDRLRIQLASMFGLMKPPKAAPDAESWRPEPTALGSSRAFGTWRSRDDDAKRPKKAIDAASMPPTAAGTGSRRRRLGETSVSPEPDADGTRSRRTPAVGSNPSNDGDLDAEIGTLDYLDEGNRPSARRVGQIVAVALVLLLIGLAAGWYYMPRVTVSSRLKETPASMQFIYSVAAPGAAVPPDAAFTLPARQGAATVPFTISMPATGTNATPDKTASGSVTLRNPTGNKIKVPTGTKLTSRAGVTYVTTKDVEVMAAKNDGAEPGETTVDIRAEKGGTSGNQKSGYLTGKIDTLGIFFSNRTGAIEGGTDITVKAVSAGDIKKIEAELPAQLPQAAAKGWQQTLSNGQAIVPQSVTPGKPTYAVNQKAGDKAENVTLSGTVDVTGLIFNQRDVDTSSRQTAVQGLTPMLPAGYALQPSTITFGEPKVIAEAANGVQFRLTATGIGQAVFDQAAQDQLARDLAGKSWKDVEARVHSVGAFATSDLRSSPGWWPQGMPQTESRVKVKIDTSVQTPGPEGNQTPVPNETPTAGSGA